jgi:hypothetical protein
MILANERDHYKNLLSYIKAIIFFGTPHSGSGIANMASILSKIVKVSSVNMNSSLLRSIKSQSGELFNISQSFADRSVIPIRTFYETDKYPFPVAKWLPFVLKRTVRDCFLLFLHLGLQCTGCQRTISQAKYLQREMLSYKRSS